jgi:DNA-binding transcriptional LysR family regulator
MAVTMSELRALLAVIRRGSFTQAAIDLPLSQPGLSRRIAVLEKKLGIQIFDRAAGAVKLTPAGQAFLPYAEEALLQLTDGMEAAQGVYAGQSGTLSVSFSAGLLRPSLVALLRRFADRHPAISLDVSVGNSSADVSAAVLSADALFGVRYRRDASERLKSQVIGEERIVIACAPGHTLARQKTVSRAMLADQVWIGPDAPAGQEAHGFGTVLARYGIRDARTITVDDSQIRKRLVQECFGIGMFTSHLIEDDLKAGTLKALHVPGLSTSVPVVIVRRRSSRQGRAETDLTAEITALFAAAAEPTR